MKCHMHAYLVAVHEMCGEHQCLLQFSRCMPAPKSVRIEACSRFRKLNATFCVRFLSSALLDGQTNDEHVAEDDSVPFA